jgi:hypothetical protein
LLVPEADHAVSARGQPCCSSHIVLRRVAFVVLRAVELDYEAALKARKVNNVRTQCDLAAELVTVELLCTE